eukprot:Blabericola_migrator_1__3687@NODE_2101_length_3272_cov_842_022153_g1332_i0_p1_GENE_NODE_2101_length_3272_cov_842_022153_g1332_i0NODE_2101_length_3272_cov_842_022153_g1332_i0_p1_ORF_typecomplete_len431_score36_22_NODE_2101_length_3272_cov_842_022153_g1332_i08342126
MRLSPFYFVAAFAHSPSEAAGVAAIDLRALREQNVEDFSTYDDVTLTPEESANVPDGADGISQSELGRLKEAIKKVRSGATFDTFDIKPVNSLDANNGAGKTGSEPVAESEEDPHSPLDRLTELIRKHKATAPTATPVHPADVLPEDNRMTQSILDRIKEALLRAETRGPSKGGEQFRSHVVGIDKHRGNGKKSKTPSHEEPSDRRTQWSVKPHHVRRPRSSSWTDVPDNEFTQENPRHWKTLTSFRHGRAHPHHVESASSLARPSHGEVYGPRHPRRDEEYGPRRPRREEDRSRRPRGYEEDGSRRPRGYEEEGPRRPRGYEEDGPRRPRGYEEEGPRRPRGYEEYALRRPSGYEEYALRRPRDGEEYRATHRRHEDDASRPFDLVESPRHRMGAPVGYDWIKKSHQHDIFYNPEDYDNDKSPRSFWYY